MTPTDRETLLERAYDAERRGDLKEAARLRAQARAEEPATEGDAQQRRAHRMTLYWPTWGR